MGRPPSIQWYYKQWLGDQKVLGMDWDAKAMHFHMLMMSIQEEPPGSLPNDMALIRRWIGSPSDDVWRRIRPQVFSAWTFRNDRWFNEGMVRICESQDKYRKRYEKSTKTSRDVNEDEDIRDFDVGSKSKEKESDEISQATSALFLDLGFAGLENRVNCQDSIKAYMHQNGCNAMSAYEGLAGLWQRYNSLEIKYKCGKGKFLKEGVWGHPEKWVTKAGHDSFKETISRKLEELYGPDVTGPQG